MTSETNPEIFLKDFLTLMGSMSSKSSRTLWDFILTYPNNMTRFEISSSLPVSTTQALRLVDKLIETHILKRSRDEGKLILTVTPKETNETSEASEATFKPNGAPKSLSLEDLKLGYAAMHTFIKSNYRDEYLKFAPTYTTDNSKEFWS